MRHAHAASITSGPAGTCPTRRRQHPVQTQSTRLREEAQQFGPLARAEGILVARTERKNTLATRRAQLQAGERRGFYSIGVGVEQGAVVAEFTEQGDVLIESEQPVDGAPFERSQIVRGAVERLDRLDTDGRDIDIEEDRNITRDDAQDMLQVLGGDQRQDGGVGTQLRCQVHPAGLDHALCAIAQARQFVAQYAHHVVLEIDHLVTSPARRRRRSCRRSGQQLKKSGCVRKYATTCSGVGCPVAGSRAGSFSLMRGVPCAFCIDALGRL